MSISSFRTSTLSSSRPATDKRSTEMSPSTYGRFQQAIQEQDKMLDNSNKTVADQTRYRDNCKSLQEMIRQESNGLQEISEEQAKDLCGQLQSRIDATQQSLDSAKSKDEAFDARRSATFDHMNNTNLRSRIVNDNLRDLVQSMGPNVQVDNGNGQTNKPDPVATKKIEKPTEATGKTSQGFAASISTTIRNFFGALSRFFGR